MSVLDTKSKRRLRGVILRLVNERHERQEHRMDHLLLWDALNELHWHLSENQLLTLLQDLCDRGWLKYTVNENRKTGDEIFSAIHLTPSGRDQLEAKAGQHDKAIEF